VSKPNRVYWDSCDYLDFLKGDHPRHDHMAALLEDWKQGEVIMVTSALTIAEVLWVRCEKSTLRRMLDRSTEQDLAGLFDPPPPAELVIVELSRTTALAARELVWKHRIKPKDAVHVASAIEGRCDEMHTSDAGLLKHDKKLGGLQPLRIIEPTWERQVPLPFTETDAERRPS